MNLYGRLSVSLVEERDYKLNSFAEIINNVICPPARVSEDDIHVRAIYLVSDQVNSYGGRFPKDELQNLCDLIIDSPVLVGHDKSELPIARNFKAEVQTADDRNWVKVWFYWLKNIEGSEALRANIDGGIYKEGSIGFIFTHPECSICGEDIRNCSHTPLKNYACGDEEQICHYNYRGIEKVLETSLVFRGANPDTRITNELFWPENKAEQNNAEPEANPAQIHFDDFPKSNYSGKMYAAPLFFGLPVDCVCKCGSNIITTAESKLRFASQVGLTDDLNKLAEYDIKISGQLFKMRGKARLPLYLWKDIGADTILSGRYCLQINHIRGRDGRLPDDEVLAQIKKLVSHLPTISLRNYKHLDKNSSVDWQGCKSRWGCELVTISDDKQNRAQIRNCHYLLLKVREVLSTRGGKYKYALAFEGDDTSNIYSTYETKISALAGETVVARVLEAGSDLKLSGLIVEDNLGNYYPADKRELIHTKNYCNNGYVLHKVKEAGLLHLKHEGLDLLVLFPQFKVSSLNDSRSLIGYPLSGRLKNQQFDLTYRKTLPVERGRLEMATQSGHEYTLKLCGKSFNGKYKISPAHWAEKELLLFSKVPE